MPLPALAIPAIMGGISALASWLGNRGNKTSTQTKDLTTTETPEYDPQALAGRNAVLDAYLQRMNNYGGYMAGYAGSGMRDINRAGDARSAALASTLAARGLSFSPVGASLAGRNEDTRLSQLTDFASTLPLVQRGLQSEDLQNFGGFISSLPVGRKIREQGTVTGAGTQPASNAWGDALGQGVSSYLLAKYYGQKNTPTYNPGNGPS